MKKAQKKQIEDLLALLEQAHIEVKRLVENKNFDEAMELLGQCQDSAVQIGELIEKTEGEDAPTIAKLEEYCETLYDIHEELSSGAAAVPVKIHKRLHKSLIRVENSVKNDIKIRLEMVFLPYKASMWDSLESVWMAADADPDCDAYVVPIPYYDKNRDGSFGTFHYEGDRLPDYVPVTHYDAYDIRKREPDAVFIHNPYDQYNHVTSVDPRFFSFELKKSTECLVYIPYFSTSGGMSEAQSSCMAYYFADYIIIQAEKFRKFYDPQLPQEKLVPMGSPKFDKVIRLCQNPPEPPEEWKEKMAGKKVYFYNTSINGLLSDTQRFMRKLKYVFQCFAKCEQACLLWRPHPLLESTINSMRPEFMPVYEKLKQYFIENNLGIYDETPEIEPTIALCDAYIGDEGSSVISLFGAAAKPIFILNNRIDSEPGEEDWRGEVVQNFYRYGNSRYMVTQGNKLYYAPQGDYQYRYSCDLCGYSGGRYYLPWVISVQGRDYVCPNSAQEILLLEEGKVVKHIKLERQIEQPGAFCGAVGVGKYLLLIPNRYPAIVRYDTLTGEIRYFKEHVDIFSDETKGERRTGTFCIWKEYLFFSSPVNNYVAALHVPSGRIQLMNTGAETVCGCGVMMPDGEELWLLPYEGYTITRWNPESGEVREYDCRIEGLQCRHPVNGYECDITPFSFPAILEEALYLPPAWGNLYLRLNKETGEINVWEPPREMTQKKRNGYYPPLRDTAIFLKVAGDESGALWQLNTYADHKLYCINLRSEEWEEVPIGFLPEQLRKQEKGFEKISEWSMYAANENAFNTLSDFLNGTLKGSFFKEARAREEFAKIAENSDGTCGTKTYEFIRNKLAGVFV